MLFFDAKHSLKNTLSFEPFKKQFFRNDNQVFVAAYKMMGRNDLGNLSETTVLVKYNPFEPIEHKTKDTTGVMKYPDYESLFKKNP